MLHELVCAHRESLISRCRLKVSRRSSPPAGAAELQHGVPLILDQLIEALARGNAVPTTREDSAAGRSAALHGAALFRLGYSIDQVVHDYGDLCQAITELAMEMHSPITVEEFHTFNHLLDSSIANAVSAFMRHQQSSDAGNAAPAVHERLGTLADEQRRLLETALKALDALKVGNIGLMGATGTVLEDSLLKLRDLIDRSLPEIRIESGMVTHPGVLLPQHPTKETL